MPPIDRGQARLARPYPGGLLEKAAAARIRTLHPETAASYLTALGTHGQPGNVPFYSERFHFDCTAAAFCPAFCTSLCQKAIRLELGSKRWQHLHLSLRPRVPLLQSSAVHVVECGCCVFERVHNMWLTSWAEVELTFASMPRACAYQIIIMGTLLGVDHALAPPTRRQARLGGPPKE